MIPVCSMRAPTRRARHIGRGRESDGGWGAFRSSCPCITRMVAPPQPFLWEASLGTCPRTGRSPTADRRATGTLGQALAKVAHRRGLPVRVTSRSELNIQDPRAFAVSFANLAVGDHQCRRLRAGRDAEATKRIALPPMPRRAESGRISLPNGTSLWLAFHPISYSTGQAAPTVRPTRAIRAAYTAEASGPVRFAMLEASSRNLVSAHPRSSGLGTGIILPSTPLTALKRGERDEAPDDGRVSPTYCPTWCPRTSRPADRRWDWAYGTSPTPAA
jgi:hypothetical protein